MDIQDYILQQFEQNIEEEGTFWRIARPDTFVDILILQAGKASKNGIDDKLAMEVVLTAIKALINRRLGAKDYTPEYKQLNKALFEELGAVHAEAGRIIASALSKSEANQGDLPLSDDLDYFKVLNTLEIENYSPDIFENILITFLGYFKSRFL